jgi:hypothetical protein
LSKCSSARAIRARIFLLDIFLLQIDRASFAFHGNQVNVQSNDFAAG